MFLLNMLDLLSIAHKAIETAFLATLVHTFIVFTGLSMPVQLLDRCELQITLVAFPDLVQMCISLVFFEQLAVQVTFVTQLTIPFSVSSSNMLIELFSFTYE
jgi:hypothetical protein